MLSERDKREIKNNAEIKRMFTHLFEVTKEISPNKLTINECEMYK